MGRENDDNSSGAYRKVGQKLCKRPEFHEKKRTAGDVFLILNSLRITDESSLIQTVTFLRVINLVGLLKLVYYGLIKYAKHFRAPTIFLGR